MLPQGGMGSGRPQNKVGLVVDRRTRRFEVCGSTLSRPNLRLKVEILLSEKWQSFFGLPFEIYGR